MDRKYSDDITGILEALDEVQEKCCKDCGSLCKINEQLYKMQAKIGEIQHEVDLEYLYAVLGESSILIEAVGEKLQDAREEAARLRIDVEMSCYIPMPPPDALGSELPKQRITY